VSGDDALVVEGVVVQAHRGDFYDVDVTMGDRVVRVLCRRSGRLIVHKIRILPMDRVTCALSVHDPSRGRILHRADRHGGA
jgi:translation initiation factor IF-1